MRQRATHTERHIPPARSRGHGLPWAGLLPATLLVGLALWAPDQGVFAQEPPSPERVTEIPVDPTTRGIPGPSFPDTVPQEPGPAAELYQEARSALNRGEYAQAMEAFRELRREHDADWVAPRSLYFEALTLLRAHAEGVEVEAEDPTERARELLELHLAEHRDEPTANDARRLLARTEGERIRPAPVSPAPVAPTDVTPDTVPPDAVNVPRAFPRGEPSSFVRVGDGLMGLGREQAVPEGCAEEELELREAALEALAGESAGPSVHLDLPPELQEQVARGFRLREGQRAVRIAPFSGSEVELEAEDRELLWEIVHDVDDPCAEALRFPALQILARDAQGVDLPGFRRVVEDRELPESARRTALYLLANEDLPVQVMEELVGDLRDEPEMMRQLLFVLSRSEEPEAAELLIELARTTEDRELQLEAVRHLQERDEPEAREFLREMLRRPPG